MKAGPSANLLEALHDIWSLIRLYHSSVPEVVLIIAPAEYWNAEVCAHFAPSRWERPQPGADPLHEVLIVAEHLDRPAEEITGTLLHEAAHALNFERGVKDYSAPSYHNDLFKEAAEHLGLRVEPARDRGFAQTRMPALTIRRYELEIENLRAVLMHRRAEVTDHLRQAKQHGVHVLSRMQECTSMCSCTVVVEQEETPAETTALVRPPRRSL